MSFLGEFSQPVRSRDTALHKEIASRNERTVGSNKERTDCANLVRRPNSSGAETSNIRL